MKFYITCFSNLRKLTKEYIPFSTALYSPKWFFDNNKAPFFNKSGVINGLEIPDLSPYKIVPCCPCESKDSNNCRFLRDYSDYLRTLDFKEVISKMIKVSESIKEYSKLEDYNIVLLVYESINNKCSERWPLIDWFKENNTELYNLEDMLNEKKKER